MEYSFNARKATIIFKDGTTASFSNVLNMRNADVTLIVYFAIDNEICHASYIRDDIAYIADGIVNEFI